MKGPNGMVLPGTQSPRLGGLAWDLDRPAHRTGSQRLSAGLLGALFMGAFLVQTFFRRSISRTPLSVELLWALKLSLLPALVMAGVDSSGPDFGIWMGVVFGAITGLAAYDPRRSAVNPGVAKRSIRSVGGRRANGWSKSPTPLRNLPRDNGPDKPAPRPSF
jgi:hypothetical protein